MRIVVESVKGNSCSPSPFPFPLPFPLASRVVISRIGCITLDVVRWWRLRQSVRVNHMARFCIARLEEIARASVMVVYLKIFSYR